MARRSLFLLAVVACFMAMALAIMPRSNRAFTKYVISPMPASVRLTIFQSNDGFGLNPEPVCYLGFCATSADIAEVIAKGGFSLAATNAYVPVPEGPDGWKTAEDCGPSRRLFIRNHPGSGGVQIGNRRNWTEYLWIDGTGTNGYFLLWGI